MKRHVRAAIVIALAVVALLFCARNRALVWMGEGVHLVPNGAAEKPVQGMPRPYYDNKGRRAGR